jgi:Porin subfamily
MKNLHTLLFAVAAGVLAIGAASAAEHHAKGAPAGQAKNCSVYGAGFHYVPSADVCMKIGGWARAEASGGGVNWGALNGNPAADGAMRARGRGYVTTDVRKQTEYGTVRAYVSVGATHQ